MRQNQQLLISISAGSVFLKSQCRLAWLRIPHQIPLIEGEDAIPAAGDLVALLQFEVVDDLLEKCFSKFQQFAVQLLKVPCIEGLAACHAVNDRLVESNPCD